MPWSNSLIAQNNPQTIISRQPRTVRSETIVLLMKDAEMRAADSISVQMWLP